VYAAASTIAPLGNGTSNGYPEITPAAHNTHRVTIPASIVIHDDNGAGLTPFKNWQGALWVNGTIANFTGGLVASGYQSQVATIRFGSYGSGGSGGVNFPGNPLATLGSGQIRMTPNSVIHLEDITNITGTRQLKLAGAATHFAVVALRPNPSFNLNANDFTQAYLANLLTTDSNGVLALEGGAVFTNSLDQSAIGNGRMYLGGANLSGVTANATYAAANLAPSSDGIYRLGGASGTLTLDHDTTTSTVGALVDGVSARRVLIGDQGQFGTGTVQFNDLNTYTGGTTLSSGTIQVGTSTALGTGALAMTGGTTLEAGANSLVLANNITTAGVGTVDTNANTLTLGGVISGPALTAVVALLKQRARTLNELAEEAMLFYGPHTITDELLAQHVTGKSG
jgi:autotransporter-associated beta strand protein